MSWNELYHELIVDHARYSPYRGVLTEGCCTHASAHQPSCGDEVDLSIAWEGDRLGELRFEGRGCMISQASTSLACAHLRRLSLEEAKHLVSSVLAMLTTGDEVTVPEDLRALKEVRRFPMRVKCATMSWHLIQRLLESRDGAH